jgi:Cu2+-containing amine oxidase
LYFRSYELLVNSDGARDGTFSTGDVWVVRYRGTLEDGADVGCRDERLETVYASPAQNVDGQDIVLWTCLRGHHLPRHQGEERLVVPYHFLGFHLEPRDSLNTTPGGLYATTPPSPP